MGESGLGQFRLWVKRAFVLIGVGIIVYGWQLHPESASYVLIGVLIIWKMAEPTPSREEASDGE